jgi:chromatin structure-remodeling complex protein RSC7
VKKPVLGGTKVGNGAWALAWLDTIMEVPSQEELERREVEEKTRLWKEAEAVAIDLDPS